MVNQLQKQQVYQNINSENLGNVPRAKLFHHRCCIRELWLYNFI